MTVLTSVKYMLMRRPCIVDRGRIVSIVLVSEPFLSLFEERVFYYICLVMFCLEHCQPALGRGNYGSSERDLISSCPNICFYGRGSLSVFGLLWEWRFFWTKEHKGSLGEFLTKFDPKIHKITVRNKVYTFIWQAQDIRTVRKVLLSCQNQQANISRKYEA